MVSDPLVPGNAKFLGQQEFMCLVSPIRRALLIQQGDLEQARRAFNSAAAVWGGARFPILPVGDDGVVPLGWVQFAEILGAYEVVDFTSDTPGQSAWTDGAADAFHLIPAPPLHDSRFWNPHPVAAMDGSQTVRELCLPGDDTLLSLAGAGGYGLEEEVPHFRTNGWNILESAPARLLATQQIAKRTALYATLPGDIDTEIHGGILTTLGSLWITDDPNSFENAVWFWNTRAIRPRSSLDSAIDVFTTIDVASSDEFRAEFVQAVERTANCTPAVVVSSTSVGEDDLRKLVESMGATEHTEGRIEERIGRRATPPSLTYRVNMDPSVHWLGDRKVGRPTRKIVQLRRPATEIAFTSPKAWTPGHLMSGYVNVDICSPSIIGPKAAPVATLFHRDARWAGEALRLKTSNLRDYTFNINLPTAPEVLRAAVQASGVTFVRSDKGQQVVGAATRDPDLAFYRRKIVAVTIAKLTAKVGRDLAREIRELRALGTVDDASIEALRASTLVGSRPARTVSQLKSEAKTAGVDRNEIPGILDEFVHRGVAEMGLVAKCSLCSLADFQRLAAITAGAVCAGCGAKAAFVPSGTGAPDVHYRLSSLIHSLSLNGGIGPLAAVALLTAEGAYVDPGVNLRRSGAHAGEVDLLGWKGSTLFAGEVKMSAAGFAHANVDRDVELAASVGADTYLAVCAEEIPEETYESLREATKAQKITLRVIDEPELFDA